MNIFAETTRSTIDTIKAHALISKALTNDTKPTPGYLFPEIARLTQSPGTSAVTLTQLLKIITPSGESSSPPSAKTYSNGVASGGTRATLTYSSSPHVLLKALKILRQLAQTGSVEFRGNLARRGKGPLAEMVGYRGQWDDIHGDRFNEDVRHVAEDLIEYMHANPVQEEGAEHLATLTEKEAAVMRSSTQELPGIGSREYDESDSEDNVPQKRIPKKKSAANNTKASPPLPGFGNPMYEKDDDNTEPTLMARLVDRLQEMTAPPPPMAMRAAYRQQTQRRQKLFVGEYSMKDDTLGDLYGSSSNSRTKGGTITMMGTNPFKRTSRTQGMAAGGWQTKSLEDLSTTRVFPRMIQFRNDTSSRVYELAQHIQTHPMRSKLNRALDSVQSQATTLLLTESRDLMESMFINSAPDSTLQSVQDELGEESLIFWGISKEVCDIVLMGLRQESSSTLYHAGHTTSSSTEQAVPVMTGLIRDMNDWIEQEDWERRLRYLSVLDALLAHPGTAPELLGCSALPVLTKTLSGSMCLEAPQRSIRQLSKYLAGHIKEEFSGLPRSKTAPKAMGGNSFQAVLACLAKIGDDIVVEARPDRFVLSTLNITRSAFATFTFTRTFFESYHLDTTAEAIKHDTTGPYLRCTILAKALMSACRIRGNVESKIEKCCLVMNAAEGVGENCRLTVEIIFKYGKLKPRLSQPYELYELWTKYVVRFHVDTGFIKIHKLLYESCPEALQVLDSIESCPSSWRLPPAAMIGFAENFSSKAEEISMKCHQGGITFKTIKDTTEDAIGSSKKFGTTVVPMNRSALEFYRLQDEIEITFSLKEFKAIIAFALTLRLPLDGYFDARCRPLLLTVESDNIVTGNFALATVIGEDEQPAPSSSPPKREHHTTKMEDLKGITTNTSHVQGHGELDLTQPENALFLDDDAEWLGALDDLEMEETAGPNSKTGSSAASVGTGRVESASRTNTTGSDKTGTPGHPQQRYLRVAPDVQIDEAPYEIEEEFRSSGQRRSKRPRYNFDEDD
ncbi:cell cycle checkpoint control protein rad9a [Mortierella claussenii]|nr:cell cycle checkpoint control protein rad9a [Mortierella claussenii]